MTVMGAAGISPAQFLGDEAPFDTLDGLAQRAASLGCVGVRTPFNAELIDLVPAVESKTCCDDLRGGLARRGIAITELSAHPQGQLVAVRLAYDTMFDGFAPFEAHGKAAESQLRAEFACDCALNHPEDAAREGEPFIRDYMTRRTERSFDDFAASGIGRAANRALVGLSEERP